VPVVPVVTAELPDGGHPVSFASTASGGRTEPTIPGRDLTSGEQWLVWLGLVAVWVVVSCLILRDRATSSPE
jgi:hypothetical protein